MRRKGELTQSSFPIAIIAAYEMVGFVGISVANLVAKGQTKAFIFFGWFAAEVVGLFFIVVFALLERLFATALKLRQEDELTVWAVPKTISDSRKSASVSPNKLDL